MKARFTAVGYSCESAISIQPLVYIAHLCALRPTAFCLKSRQYYTVTGSWVRQRRREIELPPCIVGMTPPVQSAGLGTLAEKVKRPSWTLSGAVRTPEQITANWAVGHRGLSQITARPTELGQWLCWQGGDRAVSH